MIDVEALEQMVSDSERYEQWASWKLFQLATESRISPEEITAAPEIAWATGAEKDADKLVERVTLSSSANRPSHRHHFESTFRSLVEDPNNRNEFADLV